jgi:hypothetical protein
MFPVWYAPDLYTVFNSVIKVEQFQAQEIFCMKFGMPTGLVLPSREHLEHFVMPLVAATMAQWERQRPSCYGLH